MTGNPLEHVTLADLRLRTSSKWRTYPPDVLPLWVAEMDVTLAPAVTEALSMAIARGDTGYSAGVELYAEALGEFAAARWGWEGVDVARTAIVADVMTGIVEVLRLVTEQGSAVVVNPPVYPPFYSFIEHLGRRIVEAPLVDGRIDIGMLGAAFEKATAGGRPAAYLLCSPHNPTGTVHTKGELTAVAALADEFAVRVVADEIHAPLVLAGAAFVPYLSVAGCEDAFSLMSASKGWNLAGMKAAVVIAGRVAAADLARLPEEVSHGPSHLGVLAHTAALREGREWLDDLLIGLEANRGLLGRLLGEHLPGISWTPPEATYLAWLDCSALALDDPADPGIRGLVTSTGGAMGAFLDRARVALSAGPAFGTGGEGHVRLNFATSGEILTEAVTRMGRVSSGEPSGAR
jgi:cystathionine beta-lyase